MKLKYELFCELYFQACEYDNVDYYVAERGWQDWMEEYCRGGDATEVSEILRRIFEISSLSLTGLRKLAGMSRAKFSRTYRIPLRTLESWEYEERELADYKLALIAYTVFQGVEYVKSED